MVLGSLQRWTIAAVHVLATIQVALGLLAVARCLQHGGIPPAGALGLSPAMDLDTAVCVSLGGLCQFLIATLARQRFRDLPNPEGEEASQPPPSTSSPTT